MEFVLKGCVCKEGKVLFLLLSNVCFIFRYEQQKPPDQLINLSLNEDDLMKYKINVVSQTE
jgi:hypothetical protein